MPSVALKTYLWRILMCCLSSSNHSNQLILCLAESLLPFCQQLVAVLSSQSSSACSMQEANLKANAKLEKSVMHCPRGPQGNRTQREEAISRLESSSRRQSLCCPSELAVVCTLLHAGSHTPQILQRSCTTTGFTVNAARQPPQCLLSRCPQGRSRRLLLMLVQPVAVKAAYCTCLCCRQRLGTIASHPNLSQTSPDAAAARPTSQRHQAEKSEQLRSRRDGREKGGQQR